MALNFDFHNRLGKGHFGEVWLVTDTGLNTKRALKLIPSDKLFNPQNMFHEAQILKEAEHPNVIHVEETGQMSDGRIYVAMEYLEKGSLEDEAKGGYVDLTRAKRIMIDVLRGLEHAHSKNILHRDIKPANILIGNNCEGVLSDFGLAIPMDIDLIELGIKDYIYILHLAPELYPRREYTISSDIYAAGVTFYRLVNGDSYLPPLPRIDIRSACIQGKYPDRNKYREFIPNSVRRLINKSINIEPTKRYQSACEMRHAIEQLIIEMNWSEKKLQNGFEWVCSWGDKCYQVSRIRNENNSYSINTKKGRSKTTLRNLSKYSYDQIDKKKAEKLTRQILQNFVLGKIK